MPRLIDAHRIVYSWTIDNDGEQHDGITLQSIIDKMPTVDAERHGHWVDEMGMILCSECRDSWGTEMEAMVRSFNFCPYCGAKMDEVEDE